MPDDSAFLKPFVGDAEARQRESEEARREIMGNIGAPGF